MCERSFRSATRRTTIVALAFVLSSLVAQTATAAEDIYFSATTNITEKLVAAINAEPPTGRIDMAIWHLTEGAITNALIARFNAGVPIRLIGDRAELFELNAVSKGEFYKLANAGVPIRVRVNPIWYPEISHWKLTYFKHQSLVAFGSANYTPFELAPVSSTNYKDETVLFSDDPVIVNAIKTKFDQIWNDTTVEPESMIPGPPYLKDWDEACETDHTGSCDDYHDQFPTPAPMIINTTRLEPGDVPVVPNLIWGQGPSFNNRLVQEINSETSLVQLVVYRMTVSNITDALLNKWTSGVPVQLMIEPNEYINKNWPEFWLTHAYLDKLWAAGVPIKMRKHQGLTHMKTLVTSNFATNASSNFAAAWQRDVNYFIPKATKPTIYQKVKDRVTAMWNDPDAFTDFVPLPPDAPELSTPVTSATAVPTTTALVWNRAAFATSYDVWMGTSSSNLLKVGNVPAELHNNPPEEYSFTPVGLQSGTTYFWRIVARTFATDVNPSLVAPSSIRLFTTAGNTTPPAAASNPSPSNSAVNVTTVPTLTWSAGTVGTTYNVAFGQTSTPTTVASGLTTPSFSPGGLSPSTTYFWRVTTVSSGGTTPGPLWSFTTSSSGGNTPGNVVIYATDVATTAGTWSKTSDPTAAGNLKLTNRDDGVAALSAPLANPVNYFETTFDATGGTRYRVWFRIHAIGDQKWNDSFFVQFSDSLTSTGSPAYRIGTPGGYTVNLWTCADCQSFGWGWQRNAYWLADTGDVWFQNSGPHTIRVQNREDGVEIDQIVLSPVTYATNPPGPVSNDNTIVPKPTPPTAPGTPGSPNPSNGATSVNTTTVLTWTSSGATTYDVKFGTANPPPQVVTGSSTASYTPALAAATTYFWQIVAKNAQGATTGPTWSFTTASGAPAPGTPTSPSPANSATGVATSAVLTWTSTGATTYDVKFGTANPPPQVVTGSSTASYTPALAAATTYFWQIVAHNAQGTTTGPTWSFTTAAAPAPPGAPASPSPANSATGVATSPVLTWSAAGATNYDVRFGTANPPPAVSAAQPGASYTPPALSNGTTYFWQIVARNGAGQTAGPVWSFTTQAAAPANIVIYASDVVPAALHGSWASASDATSPNGTKLVTTDTGAANLNNPVAAPTDYFEVPFTPAASVPYTIWLRLRALNNNKFNDAVWVQFSNASAGGGQVYSIGSTSGLLVNLATDSNATSLNAWGWQNTAYWLGQSTTLTFPAGTQTLRIQIREDGVQLDQIVLSPATYLNTPPGPVGNDNTIVPKPTPPGPPTAPASPTPASGATNVGVTPTLTWSASGATSYDVRFGTANPPPQVVTGQAASSYAPATLQHSTLYFWQIVARNGAGSVNSPVWSFTTAAAPPAPSSPSSPAPANLATGVPTSAALSWTAANATSFDVKFGTANPPTTVVSAGQAGTTYSPALVAGITYFWQVTAINATSSTTGPVWSFTTAATPPATPGSPSPGAGATGVSPSVMLSWSASGASNYDVRFGTANPPPSVSTAQAAATYNPGTLSSGITYFWQIVAHNAQGTATGPIWSFTTAVPPPGNIVIYAGDIPPSARHGSWATAADATSPGAVKLVTSDVGATNLNNPVASPVDYVDVSFTAAAGTPYTLWLRLKALGNSKFNDAVWVQFSGASANGAPVYPINSTAGLMVNLATDATATSLNGWGWQNSAYWLSQTTTVTFPAGGAQTLRIQIREDGVQLDQIVLSPSAYLSTAPGPVTNDSTIVPKP